MLKDLFRTKSLEQLRARAEDAEHPLKRHLGTFDLTMFGIGAIIGAGIFSSILLAVAACALGRLCLGELYFCPVLCKAPREKTSSSEP